MTKQEQFAYAAGLLDAEGCFHASRNESCNTFRYGITVNMDHAAPLRRLAGLFGSEVKPRKDGGFSWAVKRDQLRRCLESVLPFLLGKRSQAELLLQMRATFEDTDRKRGVPPPQEIVESRANLTRSITALKYVTPLLVAFRIPKKKEAYAYVAGLFDGDGSFGVYHGAGRRYVPTAQLGMIDPTPVAFVRAVFGGNDSEIEHETKRDVNQLVLVRREASELCKKTAVYRTIKREQADIVVRLENNIQLWKSRANHGLPAEVIAKRHAWFERTHFLNSLSVRAETNPSRSARISDSPNLTEPQGKEAAEMTARYAIA